MTDTTTAPQTGSKVAAAIRARRDAGTGALIGYLPVGFPDLATSIEAAVTLLGQLGDDTKIIAGGQSLVPMMALRLANFEHLVDLARQAARVGPEDPRLGESGVERVHRVRKPATLADLLEQPRRHPSAEGRAQDVQWIAAIVGPRHAGHAQDQVCLLGRARQQPAA